MFNWEPEGRYQYSRCSIESQKGAINIQDVQLRGAIAVHSLRVGCKPAVVFYTGFKKKSNILTVTLFRFNNFERQQTNLIGLFGTLFVSSYPNWLLFAEFFAQYIPQKNSYEDGLTSPSTALFELTISRHDARQRDHRQECDGHPVQHDTEPARGGEEEKPRPRVVVLVRVKLSGEVFLDLERSDGDEAL